MKTLMPRLCRSMNEIYAIISEKNRITKLYMLYDLEEIIQIKQLEIILVVGW